MPDKPCEYGLPQSEDAMSSRNDRSSCRVNWIGLCKDSFGAAMLLEKVLAADHGSPSHIYEHYYIPLRHNDG